MGFFDAPPASTSSNTTSSVSNGLPDWYQQYEAGIGAMGANYASQPFTPYTGPRVAGMNSAQTGAIAGTQAIGTNGNTMLPAAQSMISQGLQTLSTPGQKWTDPGVADKYMSPYTKNVVDEIGRLGTQNFNEGVMPQVQDAFVGSGGFGSTRNVDILGRAARDSAMNTTGLQSTALQNGYGVSAGIFGNDASRALTQQTAAGNAGITGGSALGTLGANSAATSLGALSLLSQQGAVQQATDQKALDAGYQDFTDQRDWDINNAGKLSSLMRGSILPTNSVSDAGTTSSGIGGGSSTAQGLLSLMAAIFGSTQPAAK